MGVPPLTPSTRCRRIRLRCFNCDQLRPDITHSAAARQISKILMRQHGHHDDIEQLATALRNTLTAEGIKTLRAELGRRQ